jgi:hypothetical protein
MLTQCPLSVFLILKVTKCSKDCIQTRLLEEEADCHGNKVKLAVSKIKSASMSNYNTLLGHLPIEGKVKIQYSFKAKQ